MKQIKKNINPFIQYIILKKINLIKKFHELTIHKGNNKLYNLIKESEF